MKCHRFALLTVTLLSSQNCLVYCKSYSPQCHTLSYLLEVLLFPKKTFCFLVLQLVWRDNIEGMKEVSFWSFLERVLALAHPMCSGLLSWSIHTRNVFFLALALTLASISLWFFALWKMWYIIKHKRGLIFLDLESMIIVSFSACIWSA